MSKSLRAKMTTIFAVVITILLLGLGWIIFMETRTKIIPTTNEMNIEIINTKGNEVGVLLNGHINLIKNISTLPDFKSGNLDNIEEILKNMNSELPDDLGLVFYSNEDGDSIDSNGNRGSIYGTDYFNNIIVYGEDFYITDAHINKETNSPVVVIVMSIPGSSSPSLVGMHLDLASFSSLLEEISISDKSITFLADDMGYVIASSDKDLILNFNIEDLQRNNELINILADDDMTSGIYNYMYNDVERALVFSKVENTSWIIAESKPITEVYKISNGLLRRLGLSIAITILLSLLLVYVISTNILKPIIGGVIHAEHLAELDLRDKIPDDLLTRQDELGILSRSLASVDDSLREFLDTIGKTSDDIFNSSSTLKLMIADFTTSINEISGAISQIAESATEQAIRTEDGSIMADEMQKALEKSIEDVHVLTNRISGLIKLELESQKVLDDLLQTTENNIESIEKVSSGILKTDSSVEEISEATRLIQEIASQTNLLALNASIEAAHAGEMGRGFAVVANEIRELAEISNKSASEIENMVHTLLEDSHETVKVVQILSEVAKIQESSVKETASAFNEVSTVLKESESLIDSVITSNEITNSKKEEILLILEELSNIAQTNASMTEEIVANTDQQLESIYEINNSSEKMSKVPEILREQINQFKI